MAFTDFVLKLLRLGAKNDLHLHWSFVNQDGYMTDEEDGRLGCFVNCNDLFAWATADAEEVTPENIGVLEQAIEDVKNVNGLSLYATSLFACRVRKMRPQKPAYPGMVYKKEQRCYTFEGGESDKKLCELFDACE